MSTLRVWALDASAIISIKIVVPGKQQWQLFKKLESLVERGHIAFPKQVAREVSELAHPDAPGVWVDGVLPSLRYPDDPDFEVLRDVMARAGQVVDPSKTKDDGDPYLLALALQLSQQGSDVCIVTEDTVDRASRIAVSSACARLGMPWCGLADFLKWVDEQP